MDLLVSPSKTISIGRTEAAFKAAVYMGMSKPMNKISANIYEARLQSEFLSAQKDKVKCITMAEKLTPGTRLVYKRCRDMEEPIRLGGGSTEQCLG